MFNQTFKNKIGLSENTNIYINIYDEDFEIKVIIQIGTHPSFH